VWRSRRITLRCDLRGSKGSGAEVYDLTIRKKVENEKSDDGDGTQRLRQLKMPTTLERGATQMKMRKNALFGGLPTIELILLISS